MMISMQSSQCFPQGEVVSIADVQRQDRLSSAQPGEAYFYRYVRNDPVNLVDPTGLSAVPNRQGASGYLPNVRLSNSVWDEAKAEIAKQYGVSGPLDQAWSQKVSTGWLSSSTVGELVTGAYGAKVAWYKARDIQIADNWDAAVQLQRTIGNQQAYASVQAGAWDYTKAYTVGAVEGTGTGIKNVVVGVAKAGREIGYQTADLANTTTYLVSGYEMYHGNLSNLGQASVRSDFCYTTHVAETGANILTFGVYGEGKLTYQYYAGHINLQTYSESMGASGVFQLGRHTLSIRAKFKPDQRPAMGCQTTRSGSWTDRTKCSTIPSTLTREHR